ncbi:MAG: YdeI/OmpD-associated family protein [FCB group bacterium]|nr:YdeI/OmpD-associated family protein [FCB group bacterium]MBL7027218.1 YdeI/OmpD-associated family protein [Candidatus Neomarinimicrobiota bacterium]MBL7120547.1 YdeI/OmpD-associated family protein [Candidatus Neomarinimicrobiota bacterium]
MYRATSVEQYIQNQPQWAEALSKLRKILLELGLEETIKWGGPVYMHEKKNIVSIGGYKSFVSLWYYQGALLKDEKALLVNAQEGVTKAQRQMRFHHIDEINATIVRSYTLEAIENHRSGKEIKADTRKPLIIPEELEKVLKSDTKFRSSFDAFTLSKRREYAEYISNAKRVETKLNRLEKITSMILDGVGLSDKYRR